MNFFISFFHVTLWQPLFNILVLFCFYLPGNSLGWAIVLITLLVRVLLYPLQDKAGKSQIALQALQPKMKEIQKKYKGNREEQAKQTMALYKKEKINPFSSILVMLIQLPILIVLYQLFLRGINEENFVYLYSFVQRPATINYSFFSLNLAQPSIWMAILVGVVFFIQAKLSTPKAKKKTGQKDKKAVFGEMMQKQMLYFFPALMVIILLKFPSALSLYLLVGGILTSVQQYFIKKKYYLEETGEAKN